MRIFFFSTMILYIFDITSVTDRCENNRSMLCNNLYEKSLFMRFETLR